MKSLENKILEKKNILVILPEKPKTELTSAVFGLALALESINKNIHLISDNSYKRYAFLHHPKKISENVDEDGDIFVSIDTTDKNIKELSYEKLENEIRIHLEPETRGFKKSAVSAKFQKAPFDLILIFGVDSEDQIANFYKKNSDVLQETDIVFINKESYSDFTFDLIYKIKAKLSALVATNLLASAMLESKNIKTGEGQKIFKTISHLFNFGANHKKIIEDIFPDKSLRSAETTGVLLKNISYLKPGLLFSKIPDFEFETLKLSSNELISAIIETRLVVPKKDDLVVLVEPLKKNIDKIGILGIFVSEDEERAEKFSKMFGGTQKNNYIVFSVATSNLKDAESKLSLLLKREF